MLSETLLKCIYGNILVTCAFNSITTKVLDDKSLRHLTNMLMFRSISSKVFANGSLFSQKCILSTNPFLIRNFSITQTKWDISIISKTADDDQLKSVTFTSQSAVLEPHHYNIEPLELTNVNT